MVAEDREQGSGFRSFFESDYERMFHTLFLACGNREEAEDFVQEAMARALERWEQVQAAQSPTGYVYKIAFKLLRRRRRRDALARRLLRREVETDPTSDVERRALVVEALKALPLTQREVVLLVYWRGMTSEEAANILGIKPGAVRARLQRGRDALRRLLGGDHES